MKKEKKMPQEEVKVKPKKLHLPTYANNIRPLYCSDRHFGTLQTVSAGKNPLFISAFLS